MEYIIYLAVAAAAYWLGWHVRGVVLLFKLSRDPRATLDLLEQLRAINEQDDVPRASNEILYRAETQNSIVYLYDAQSGKFLGQGASEQKAINHALVSRPGASFRATNSSESHQTA